MPPLPHLRNAKTAVDVVALIVCVMIKSSAHLAVDMIITGCVYPSCWAGLSLSIDLLQHGDRCLCDATTVESVGGGHY